MKSYQIWLILEEVIENDLELDTKELETHQVETTKNEKIARVVFDQAQSLLYESL